MRDVAIQTNVFQTWMGLEKLEIGDSSTRKKFRFGFFCFFRWSRGGFSQSRLDQIDRCWRFVRLFLHKIWLQQWELFH
jgi:hypothetical protein